MLSSLLIRMLRGEFREQMLPEWHKYSNEFYTVRAATPRALPVRPPVGVTRLLTTLRPPASRQLIYEEVTSTTVEKQLLGMQYILELLPLEIDDRASMVTNFGACASP